MNTSQDSRWQVRRVTAALAATALAGAALAVPSAANARQTSDGGRCVACAPRTALPHRAAFTFVIDDFVAERKTMMAQDRVDRAWLYR